MRAADADPRLRALLARQAEHCPRALRELRRDGRKSSHWAWWVFPTEKEGAAEPPPKTCVTRATASALVAAAPRAWRDALEETCRLVEADGRGVLPRIDHDRVRYFVRFWAGIRDAPAWLRAVCARLGDAFDAAPGAAAPGAGIGTSTWWPPGYGAWPGAAWVWCRPAPLRT